MTDDPSTTDDASLPGGSGPTFSPFEPTIDPSSLGAVPHLARMSHSIEPKLMESAGRYARGAVLFAFEAVGGAPALAEWAKGNKDDFYTKLFPKIITREQEVREVKTVDDLTALLDDAEYAEIVEDEPPFQPAVPFGPQAGVERPEPYTDSPLERAPYHNHDDRPRSTVPDDGPIAIREVPVYDPAVHHIPDLDEDDA